MIDIKGTLKNSPIRAVIFGKDGVGKSTFCAGAPGAVFVAVESGLDNIDAQSVAVPLRWEELIESVQALGTDSRCGSIVIDSLDWAEELCWRHVCEQGDDKGRKQKNIESFGYGKGYVAALASWRVLVSELQRARDNGKNVLLIAHAERKSVKNPTGEDYDAWSIKLHAKAAGLFREWVDVVGFAELDIATVEVGKDRHKGMSSGKRVLRTQPTAGFESKTRFDLPESLPLDWSSFASAIKAGRPLSVAQLESNLESKLSELADSAKYDACATFLASRGRTFASLSEAISAVNHHLKEKRKSQ